MATIASTSKSRKLAALAVASGADIVQLAAASLFLEGVASPFNDVLDLAVAGALVWLLGFHWVLLPAAAGELMPGIDLAPTWTASVLFLIAPPKWRWLIAGVALAMMAAIGYALYWLVR